MIRGGVSDPRNKTILKMFNLLDIGERSGSGVPNIFNVWSDQRRPVPVIEEDTNPARTRLILVFDEKQANKTSEHKEKIILFLRENGKSKAKDIAQVLSLSPARVRVILSGMVNDGMITAEGKTNSRMYSLTE